MPGCHISGVYCAYSIISANLECSSQIQQQEHHQINPLRCTFSALNICALFPRLFFTNTTSNSTLQYKLTTTTKLFPFLPFLTRHTWKYFLHHILILVTLPYKKHLLLFVQDKQHTFNLQTSFCSENEYKTYIFPTFIQDKNTTSLI